MTRDERLRLQRILEASDNEALELEKNRQRLAMAAIQQPFKRKEKRWKVGDWIAANELHRIEKEKVKVTPLKTPHIFALLSGCALSRNESSPTLDRVRALKDLAFHGKRQGKLGAQQKRAAILRHHYYEWMKQNGKREPSRNELWNRCVSKVPKLFGPLRFDKVAKSRTFNAARLSRLKTSQGRPRTTFGRRKGCSLND